MRCSLFSLACGLFCGLLAGQPAAAADGPLTKGLVAWWKLDETEGQRAADSSGHEFHGELVGKPKWEPMGNRELEAEIAELSRRLQDYVANDRPNSSPKQREESQKVRVSLAQQLAEKTKRLRRMALELNGDGDYVAIPEKSKAHFDLPDAITVAAWIKVNKFDKKWQTIVAKGDLSWRIARDKDTDCVQFAFNAIPKEQIVKGKIPVNDGKWHNVAGVFDGKNKKMYLYVDGKLDGSAETTTNIPVSEQPVLIGENAQAKGRFWNGMLSDVRIYDRPLTAEEVATLGKVEKAAPQ
jgi:hypothetical protein